MVRESVDLLELLRKQAAGGDIDFLREAVAVLAEAVMEAEVAAQIGTGHGERSPERTTWRNGYRPRRWDTRAGSIELQIPKLRQGSYFPALLEPRRRAERALLSVVQQAYVETMSHLVPLSTRECLYAWRSEMRAPSAYHAVTPRTKEHGPSLAPGPVSAPHEAPRGGEYVTLMLSTPACAQILQLRGLPARRQ